MEQPILKVKDLTKKYNSLTAVDHISFEIKPGEIIGLLGPNGAGKTTTINMILGILEPTAGLIEILGKDFKKNRSLLAEKINFAAVYAHLPGNLTVYQNLYVFGLLYNSKNLKEKISQLMRDFDLIEFRNTKTGLLSSGEMSRLNIAKAIINNPCLLLLDEPTASLDPNIALLIREKIKEQTRRTNAAVLWTSHNMREIKEVCDKVLFLSKGKILLSGDPKTLPEEHGKRNLEELFIAVAREPVSFEEK